MRILEIDAGVKRISDGTGFRQTNQPCPRPVFQTRFLFANKMRIILNMVSCRELLKEKVHKINKEATTPP
jgi:hypothetical protein